MYIYKIYIVNFMKMLVVQYDILTFSYSLTLIDALDTLAIMGNFSEFKRVATLLIEVVDFNRDIDVSVFETNIRSKSRQLCSY